MAYLNHSSREINVKVAWLTTPPGLGQVEALYGALDPSLRTGLKRMTLESGEVRTFEFAPKGLGEIRGYRLRIHVFAGALTTAPDRELLARGADVAVVVDEVDTTGMAAGACPVLARRSSDAPVAILKDATKQLLLALKQPQASSPAPQGDEHCVYVGPYGFLLPEWCRDAEVVDRTPLHRLDGIHTDGISLSFAVWVDQGTPAAVDDAIRQTAEGWQATASEPLSLELEGVGFSGVASHGTARDPNVRLVETYAGVCGPDLVVFNIIFGPDEAKADHVRELYLAMVRGAIVRGMTTQPERFRPRQR